MKAEEIWIQKRWRPAVAVTYIVICVFDFILFPLVWPIFEWHTKAQILQWTPLTLQGGGLFHISFGAILGVSAWTRGQEKVTAWGRERTIEQGYNTPPPSQDHEPPHDRPRYSPPRR